MGYEETATAVEPRSYIREASTNIVVRRNGDESVFLRPDKLDGDGELHLTLANLGAALKILGFNPADVFPEG